MITRLVLILLFPALLIAQNLTEELEYARRLHQDGIHDLAAEQCRQLRSRHPDAVNLDEILDLEAQSWFAIQHYEDARKAWQRLSLNQENSPLAGEAQRRVAICLDSLGRSDDAARAWKHYAERFPEEQDAPVGMLAAYNLWDPRADSDRRALLELVANRWPDHAAASQARLELAKLDLGIGEAKAARRNLQTVLRTAAEPRDRARALEILVGMMEREAGSRAALELVQREKPAGLGKESAARLFLVEARLLLIDSRETNVLSMLDSYRESGFPISLQDSLGMLEATALAASGQHLDAARRFNDLNQPTLGSRASSAWCLTSAGDHESAVEAWTEVLDLLTRVEDSDAGLLDWSVKQFLLGASNDVLGASLANRIAAMQVGYCQDFPPQVAWISWLLEQGHDAAADQLLQKTCDTPEFSDDRILLRLRLALKREQWKTARQELTLLEERCPLSPLLAEAMELERHVLEPHENSLALQEQLLGLMVRQDEDPALLALEFGRLYLHNMNRPREAKTQFAKALVGLKADSLQAAAAYGLLSSQVELDESPAAIETWGRHGATLQQHWTALPSLLKLWKLDDDPDQESYLERLRVLAEYDAGENDSSTESPLLKLGIAALESPSATRDSLASDSLRLFLESWLLEHPAKHEHKLVLGAMLSEANGQDSLALDQWRNLRDTAPDSKWRIRADLAIAASPRSSDSERLSILRELEEQHPYHPSLQEVGELRAGLLLKNGQPEKALLLYQELDRKYNEELPLSWLPHPGSGYDYNIALCFEALGKHADARLAWTRFMRGAGSRDRARGEEAMLQIAISWARSGDFEQASLLGRNLLQLSSERPVSLRTRRFLASLYAEQGQFGQALQLLEAAKAPTSSDPELRCSWVRALYHNAHFDKGRVEFKRILQQFGGSVDADTVKASMNFAKGSAQLRKGNPSGAVKSFRHVLKEFPASSYAGRARLGLARARMSEGKADKALEQLPLVWNNWPDSPEAGQARLLHGRLMHETGDSRGGMRALRELAESNADDELRRDAFALLIRVYREEGFPDGALQSLRRYLREFPEAEDRFSRKMEAALLSKDLGDLETAEGEMRELIPEADQERGAALQFYIGECLQQGGDLRGAVLEYLKVPYLGRETKLDWDVTALYQAGQCWEELGEAGRAYELYRKIITQRGAGSTFGSAAQERINLLRASGALEDRNQP